jgi:hypothetical protein
MTPELLAPVAVVLFAAVVLVHTQWLAPRRARRRLFASLASQGWTAVPPESESDWPAILTLAIEEAQGSFRAREWDETVGPATFHVKRTEKRSGRALEVYRDAAAARARYAAVGTREKRTVSRSFANRRQGGSVAREIWIGEARPIPVDQPQMVFSGAAEIIGTAGRAMARARGVDPEAIPELATPPGDALARTLRESLLKDGVARRLMARVFLGPQAWVLVVPLARLGRRIDDVVGLAREIAATIDRRAEPALSAFSPAGQRMAASDEPGCRRS